MIYCRRTDHMQHIMKSYKNEFVVPPSADSALAYIWASCIGSDFSFQADLYQNFFYTSVVNYRKCMV